jgi:hypothetical protein
MDLDAGVPYGHSQHHAAQIATVLVFGVAIAILPSPDSNKHPFQSKPVLNMEIPF